MIELINASLDYQLNSKSPVTGIKNVSLKVHQNESICILGKSGSGKSTLLDVLASLQNITRGVHRVNGRNITKFSQRELAALRNEEMGFVFQSFNLVNQWSIEENILLPVKYARDKKKCLSRYKMLTQELQITSLLKRRPFEISGGQKQRVAIARALINDPSYIFADEPTGSLDTLSSEMVIELLQNLIRKDKSLIMVTHEMAYSHMFNRILNVNDGQVSES